jgi:hypothetical protein
MRYAITSQVVPGETPGLRAKIIIITRIIVIIILITFMQAIYNYIPETNRLSRVHSVATLGYIVLQLFVQCLCYT